MEQVWFPAALWLALALVATLLAIWFRISTALSEIVVGTVAQLIIGALVGSGAIGSTAPWITFLAGNGRYRKDACEFAALAEARMMTPVTEGR
jgi:glutathione-regulated potassium-efflux system ancillary protein KefC